MPSIEDLASAATAFAEHRLSLDDFEDRFRDNSRGMFGGSPRFQEACLLIEAAISRLRFEAVDESVSREDLAAALRAQKTTAQSIERVPHLDRPGEAPRRKRLKYG
jgi:hypothetical protein